MAYQFPPRETDTKQSNNSEGAAPSPLQQAHHVSSATQVQVGGSPQALLSAVARSNPISIRRTTSKDDGETSSDEDLAEELDALHMEGARSLPSNLLLRAPLLGSIPTNEEHMRRRNLLPPPITLSEQQLGDDAPDATHDTVSYGSLRDSQLRGQFLEGPRSYRKAKDSNRNVRFQMASSAPARGLSIGERIERSRRQQQEMKKKQSKKESSLSAMLEGSPDVFAESSQQASGLASLLHVQGDESERNFNHMMPDDTMLSSSLTGLEVLQRGFRGQQQNQPPTASPPSILPRSFSDPAPSCQHPAVLLPPGPRGELGFLLPPARGGEDTTVATSSAMTSLYSYGQQPQAAGATSAVSLGGSTAGGDLIGTAAAGDEDEDDEYHDPNTEGAFDLDLE